MDTHDRVHYAIGGLAIAGTIATGAVEMRSPAPRASHEWAFPSDQAKADFATALHPIGPHAIRIACAADCGDLPEDLTAAFTAGGWQASPETVFGQPRGILIGPDTPDAHALAGALTAALGVKVTVGPTDNLGLLIVIGRHSTKD